MRFKYTLVEDSSLPKGVAYLPLIDIQIGKYKIPQKCLIDSGSPVTIIHSPIGVAAGLIPANGKKGSLFGVGAGKIKGYYHSVKLSLEGHEFKAMIFLSADLMTPYGLLGQIGFFENFRVDFRLSHRYFNITPIKNRSLSTS